jgi:hypothetical protein
VPVIIARGGPTEGALTLVEKVFFFQNLNRVDIVDLP